MNDRSKNSAKETVIEFIKGEYDTPFEFVLSGDTIAARNYIHRMRVELSRLRQIVINRGRAPKTFKMLTESIEVATIVPPRTRIVLVKTDKYREYTNDLDGIFDVV